MSSKLNMQDLIDLLVSQYEMDAKDAERFVVEFFNIIEQGLTSDELVKIKDFGTFKLTPIQERESIDVNTQEKIVIPAHRRVSFLPAQVLKTIVNKPFEHFETTPLNDGIYLENVEQNNPSEIAAEEDATSDDAGDENDSDIMDISPIEIDSIEPVVIHNLTNSLLVEASSHLDEINKTGVISDQEQTEEITKGDIVSDTPPPTHPKDKPLKNGKPKRPFLWFYIAMAVFMIFAVSIAYNLYFSKENPSERDVDKREIPKPIKESTPLVEDSIIVAPPVIVDSVRTVSMSPGKTLRLIALDELGSRDFWVYIYLKNKDKIKNPDVVPVGIELTLPNKNDFDLDASNPESVSKAKKLGDEEMKKFW